MDKNHTHFHKLEEKTYYQNFQYPVTSEYTEIQLTHVDQCGQDQTPPPTEIPTF